MKSRLQLYLTSDILVPQAGSMALVKPGGTTAASAPVSPYSYLTGGGAGAGCRDVIVLCGARDEPEIR